MSDGMSEARRALIRRRNRRRFVFSALTIALYFSFVFNWTDGGALLARRVSGSLLTGGILMFIALVISFTVLEYIYLRLSGINLSRSPGKGE